MQRLSQFFESLFRPRRVSIAIDDLPLFGERGEAVRAQVLEPRWLSPVWVEFRGDQILAFGLWLPRKAGLPDLAGQGHPGASDRHNKTRHNQENSKDPVLPDTVGAKSSDVGVTYPLTNSKHAATRGYDSGVRPAACDTGNQGSGRYAGDGMPPVQVFADAWNAHRAITSSIEPRVHTRSLLDGLVRPTAVALIILMFILLVRA